MAAILDVQIVASFLDLTKLSVYMATIAIRVTDIITSLYPQPLKVKNILTAHQMFATLTTKVVPSKIIPEQLPSSFS
jgi:hypothetical protein